MAWRCEELGYQQRWKCPIPPGIFQSQQQKVFKVFFLLLMCIEVRFNMYAFCTETDIHGMQLIQLDGKNPHFTKLQISQWSTFDHRVETLKHWAQWNINSLMVKWVQIWNSILSHTHKKPSWWSGLGSWWIASFRIPIISTTRKGLFVKCIDWSLLNIWATFWQST